MHQVAIMDATGNVIRPLKNGKKLLYYKRSFANATEGSSTIPIAGMLTSDQSEPRILNFIRTFQYAERQVRKTNIQPVLLNTDWELTILCGLMKEFNFIEDFTLQRIFFPEGACHHCFLKPCITDCSKHPVSWQWKPPLLLQTQESGKLCINVSGI